MLLEYKLTVRSHFEAAHHLPGHPKCGGVHGHRWEVEVEITTLRSDAVINDPEGHGMAVDFGMIKERIGQLDHPGQELNDTFVAPPTAEVIAGYLLRIIAKDTSLPIQDIVVRLWESPDNCVEVRAMPYSYSGQGLDAICQEAEAEAGDMGPISKAIRTGFDDRVPERKPEGPTLEAGHGQV